MVTAFQPARFGPPGRQLFGLLQRPVGAPNNGHAVLLCNPFGQEAIRCHRLYRVLGDRLARLGFHSLRFDYLGTGDSDGDEAVGTLEQWRLDTIEASRFLVENSAAGHVSWFGLRLGGTIAAMASSGWTGKLERLILWDAIIDGKKYLAESIAIHHQENAQEYGPRWKLDSGLRSRLMAQTENQILGFELTASLRSQIAGVGPESFATMRANSITAFVEAAGASLPQWELMRGHRAELGLRTVTTGVQWASNEAMNSALVPSEALQAISSALNAV